MTTPKTPRKSYSEMLRDPRWQKKRLEVFEDAGWACAECGKMTEELHVHHLLYRRGAKPWEYEPGELSALCSKCHEETESAKQAFEITVAEYVSMMGRHSEVYRELRGYLDAVLGPCENTDDPAYLVGAQAARLCSAATTYSFCVDENEKAREGK